MTIGWPVRASACPIRPVVGTAAKPVASDDRAVDAAHRRPGCPPTASPPKADVTPGSTRERNACRDQRQRFLAAARENERMTALEPHDLAAFRASRISRRVDIVLRNRRACRRACRQRTFPPGWQLRRFPPTTSASWTSASAWASADSASSVSSRDRPDQRRLARHGRAQAAACQLASEKRPFQCSCSYPLPRLRAVFPQLR